MALAELQNFPALSALYDLQVALTPRHATALRKRIAAFGVDHLSMANEIAGCIATLAGGDIERVVRDYDWICNAILQEELHFRRSGAYRLSSFADAVAEVYSNDDLMSHYMNGLLMTEVWWSNHTAALLFYVDKFLRGFSKPYSHLEIGPGHGLLLYLAGRERLCGSIHAWDVSAESIEQTRHAMTKLSVGREVELHVQDIYAAPAEKQTFDSIVLSEVLEHLEHPREALDMIKPLLNKEGRLFINMPVNSPAPDHLFLLKSPEAVVDFVASCGYRIEQSQFEPQTGMSIEQARRTQSTITTLVIATP